MVLDTRSLSLPDPDGGEPTNGKAVSLIDASDWLSLAPLAPLFDAVPPDPYVAAGWRAKAIARVSLDGSVPVVGPHEPLYQSTQINPVHGGYDRHYPPLADEMVALLGDAVRLFVTAARLPGNTEVLVQAQRVTAGPDGAPGHPAVEGFHQDDVDWVGILLVARSGLSGGETLVSATGDEAGVVFSQTLQAGQLLVVRDRAVWHYTTPVQDTGHAPGHRDVILFGWPSARRPADGWLSLPVGRQNHVPAGR